LNCTLDGVTLVPEIRKPFDVLAEGLLSENSRRACPIFEHFADVVKSFAAVFAGPLPPYLKELVDVVKTVTDAPLAG